MSRPRVYSDMAAKQRAYRERLKARLREAQGPKDAELARTARDLHIRLQYEAANHPGDMASGMVGKDALETLQNVRAHLAALLDQ